MSFKQIGFIGGGNMAGAIIQGLIKTGTPAECIHVCDLSAETLSRFQSLGCQTTFDAGRLIQDCEAVVLAVKPQVLKNVLQPLAETANAERPLFISVVAAIESSSIEGFLGDKHAIVRTMPNTPALVQTGATGLFANARVSQSQKNNTFNLFSGIGQAIWVEDEALLHSVTAASGSAPAYFFRFAEAMINSAIQQGLNKQQARTLVSQTMLGAATMIQQESDQSVRQMRINVCSPNGTTERAIESFEQDNIEQIVERAMDACFARSLELSKELSN